MKLVAYVLAADPTWIIPSIRSYYDIVEEIVVSYDKQFRGWTGSPIPVTECIDRIRSIDRDKKVKLLAGDYSRTDRAPIGNDTQQRQGAIDFIGNTADWILELDTDEILPDALSFREALIAAPAEFNVVEWPMRTFFQRASHGRFLEVTKLSRRQCSEYPGPIATRRLVKVTQARRADTTIWRVGIRSPDFDAQTNLRYSPHFLVPKKAAVLHMSWVRSEEEMRRKVLGWGHSRDFDAEMYLDRVWRTAPRRWMLMHNFHPLVPRIWPALWPTRLPEALVSGCSI